MTFYAVATWALAVGLSGGWSVATFKTFFYFGAIANIPLLAAGAVHLNASATTARRFTVGVVVFLVLGGLVVLATPLQRAIEGDAIPEGSDLFEFTTTLGGMSLPGPRVFAAIAGGLGTILIVVLAVRSVWRTWRPARRIAVGNLLIVAGVLAPASGGSLVALGEGGGLAASLLAGAILLWSGFRVATSEREPAAT